MVKSWGEAPGDVFVYDDDVIIPGFSNGNLWITVQATPWIWGECIGIYHDPCLPSTTSILSVLSLGARWSLKLMQLSMLGTHGSLEWLPGKGAGLSASCYPEIGFPVCQIFTRIGQPLLGKAYKPSGVVRLA